MKADAISRALTKISRRYRCKRCGKRAVAWYLCRKHLDAHYAAVDRANAAAQRAEDEGRVEGWGRGEAKWFGQKLEDAYQMCRRRDDYF